jgi:hypothetical protein
MSQVWKLGASFPKSKGASDSENLPKKEHIRRRGREFCLNSSYSELDDAGQLYADLLLEDRDYLPDYVQDSILTTLGEHMGELIVPHRDWWSILV